MVPSITFMHKALLISLLVSFAWSNTNIIIRNNGDTHPYWIAFTIENEDRSCCGEITNVEISDNNAYVDQWIPFKIDDWNAYRGCVFDTAGQGPFTAPLSLRISQSYHDDVEVIEAVDLITNINNNTKTFDFGTNFCRNTRHPTQSPLDISSSNNIILQVMNGIHHYWIGFTILNEDLSCGGNITNVEISDSINYADTWVPFWSDDWIYGQCQFDHINDRPFSPPLSVRISKTSNVEVLEASNVITCLSGGMTFDFGTNFCRTIPPTLYPTLDPTSITSSKPTKLPTLKPTKSPITLSLHPIELQTQTPTVRPTDTPTINFNEGEVVYETTESMGKTPRVEHDVNANAETNNTMYMYVAVIVTVLIALVVILYLIRLCKKKAKTRKSISMQAQSTKPQVAQDTAGGIAVPSLPSHDVMMQDMEAFFQNLHGENEHETRGKESDAMHETLEQMDDNQDNVEPLYSGDEDEDISEGGRQRNDSLDVDEICFEGENRNQMQHVTNGNEVTNKTPGNADH